MTDNFSDNMLKYENYKEQNNNNKKERLKDLMANCNLGGTLLYGKYQANPIKWIVLEKTESRLLLITEKPLFSVMYGSSDSIWRTSQIRERLNSEYYNSFFTDEEKELIGETTVSNGVDGKTTDKLFLLSRQEINKYLPNENDRLCGDDWQTREVTYYVHKGKIREFTRDYASYAKRNIRPAICLKVESEKKRVIPTGYKSIFKYSKDDKGIIISGYKGEDLHMVIPEEIDGLPVYKIKAGAFKNSKRFNEITLPKTVREIGYEAFLNSELQIAHIDDLQSWAGVFNELDFFNEFNKPNVKLIHNGEEINQLDFKDVPIINKSSFAGCPGIRKISIGSGVRKILHRAFYGCPDVKTVEINSDDIEIYSYAFGPVQRVNLSGNIKYIGNNAFFQPSFLAIYGLVEDISYNAISLSNIKEIDCNVSVLWKLLNSVNSDDAARFCVNYLLNMVKMTDELSKATEEYISLHKTNIRQFLIYEFKNNSGLNRASSMNALKERFGIIDTEGKLKDNYVIMQCGDYLYSVIDGEAFVEKYTGDADEIVVPDVIDGLPVTEIAAYAFYGKNIKTVNLPETIHAIGAGCFKECEYLESIRIPELVTVIEKSCFEKCGRLKHVECPSELRTIEGSAFENCTILEKIKLPEKLLYLDNAFDYCSRLTQIVFPESLLFINCHFFACHVDRVVFPRTLYEIGEYGVSQNVKEIVIPPNTEIPDNRFLSRCEELKKIQCSEQQIERLFDFLDENAKMNIVVSSIVNNQVYKVFHEYISRKSEEILQKLILNYDGKGLEECLPILKKPDITKWIEFSQKRKKNTSLAILLDYQSKSSHKESLYNSFDLGIKIKDDFKNRFSYKVNGDSIRIGKMKKDSDVLEIPEIIQGKTVTEIASRAYSGKQFQKVSIPKSIIRIGRDAFSDCSIGVVEIEDLSAWKKIAFETLDSNPIQQITRFLVNGSSIDLLQYDENDAVIRNYSFARIRSIKKLVINGSNVSIGERAFCDCSNLCDIEIKGKLKSVASDAFLGCGITRINTSHTNMKKILNTVNVWVAGDLIDKYISGNVSVNDAAVRAFEEYFVKQEKNIIERFIYDFNDKLLASFIKIHHLKIEKLPVYIKMAEEHNYSPCIELLRNYQL